MELAIITARINKKVKKLVDQACASKGLVMAKFVEDALLDKLEEILDLKEIEGLRNEPTKPFNEVLKELKALK